jgi:NAD(P)-dependent dehydrogenase (short-subunit alcohol dehydrogenase family)
VAKVAVVTGGGTGIGKAVALALAVVYMASLPLDANVQFITVMATRMPYVGRG